MDESELKFYFDGAMSESGGFPEYELVDLQVRNKRIARAGDTDVRKRELNFHAFDKLSVVHDVLISTHFYMKN